MTMMQLAKMICKHEGKKQEVNIAQVMEILKILYTIDAEHMFRGNFKDAPLTFLNVQSVKVQKSMSEDLDSYWSSVKTSLKKIKSKLAK